MVLSPEWVFPPGQQNEAGGEGAEEVEERRVWDAESRGGPTSPTAMFCAPAAGQCAAAIASPQGVGKTCVPGNTRTTGNHAEFLRTCGRSESCLGF